MPRRFCLPASLAAPAAAGAASGVKTVVFVHASAPPAKLVQMASYGARVEIDLAAVPYQTLSEYGFFVGDIDNPVHHDVYELFAAVVVALFAAYKAGAVPIVANPLTRAIPSPTSITSPTSTASTCGLNALICEVKSLIKDSISAAIQPPLHGRGFEQSSCHTVYQNSCGKPTALFYFNEERSLELPGG